MNKILYNACYGGYGFSIKFQEAYWKSKGINYTIVGTTLETYLVDSNEDRLYLPTSRHHKELIHLVEAFKVRGCNPSANFADIQIEEIQGNQYIIEEYDGFETVVEPQDIEWTTI